ncbi:MAG: ATP-binding cassette domain-containing protein [Firmicutes bacterium]|nr:ATP-binding cassette domain-containing protein [Bacillota bacterium]
MILALKDVEKAFGIDVILEKITFNLEEREKAAIVGVNGAGKTTLFKIITGEMLSDSGDVFIRKNAVLGYLKQNAVIESGKTVYDETVSVFAKIMKDEETLRQMECEMASLEGEKLEEHMKEYSALQHSFEQSEGYSYKSRTKGVLKGLGFSEEDFDKPVSQLSGGQKTRVHLSKLLLEKPDVLLLDEPTNHLDIESVSWLEDYLKGYQGAVLVISHDRYFMDKIVTKTIEIENRKSAVYEGNYTFYAKQKAVKRQTQLKQYMDQQKEIKRQEEVIRTLRAFNREKSIKRAESREKMLDKMEKVEKPENLPEKMRLALSPRIVSGNDVLYAEGLSKSFPDKKLFEGICLDIKREDKVAIIGPNGIGKSTLFKMLLGNEKPDSGFMRFGTNVNVGYYDQEQQNFDESKTVFQEISDSYPNIEGTEIRNILASFVFVGDDVFKPVGALSGGERGRLMLAKIMLGKANLLMLDEPTNHLDMFSKEILEDAINNYEGTVVYISHDRYFINRTAKKVLELTPEGVIQYLGNYDYYIEKKTAKEREEQLFGNTAAAKTEKADVSSTKRDWQSQKEQQARERKQKNRILKLEREIEEAENKISQLDEKLLQPEIATNALAAQEIFEEKTAVEEKLEELFVEWENAQTGEFE